MKPLFGEWAGEFYKLVFYIQQADHERFGCADFIWALGEPAFDDRPWICANVWLGDHDDYRLPGSPYQGVIVAIEYLMEHLDTESFDLYRRYIPHQYSSVVQFNGSKGVHEVGRDTRRTVNEAVTVSEYVGEIIKCAALEAFGKTYYGMGHGYWRVDQAQKHYGVRLWPQGIEQVVAERNDLEAAKSRMKEALAMARWQYVYAIRYGNSRLFKIGISKTPKSRLSSLQTGTPEPLAIAAQKRHEFAGYLERALHETFKDWSVRGEWFEAPSDEDAERLLDFVRRDWAPQEIGLVAA